LVTGKLRVVMNVTNSNPDASTREDEPALTKGQKWIAAWGVLGVSLFLFRALASLTPHALEPLKAGALNLWHGALYAAWVLFNAYAEGYRAFHKGFSPRVVRRAFQLARQPDRVDVLFAPVIAMGLFRAPRRSQIVAWSLVGVIVLLVIGVRSLPQPWRGIIDGGVVIGLGIGVLSLFFHFARALRH
jgi:hypothetical protein